jgi:hypothetical protein
MPELLSDNGHSLLLDTLNVLCLQAGLVVVMLNWGATTK